MLFSKQLERFKKNKKRRSSPHVEIESTCGDDRQFLIRSPSAAGDRHQNGEHRGGRLSSCQKKSLVLFTVCLFFCSSESFEKFGLPPEKKTGGKLWAGPPTVLLCQRMLIPLPRLAAAAPSSVLARGGRHRSAVLLPPGPLDVMFCFYEF